MMDHRFETTHPLSAEIKIPSGKIEVVVHDEPTLLVRVDGVRDPDDVAVEFHEGRGGRDRVQVTYRGKKFMGFLLSGVDLAVELTVPDGTDLDVSTGSADLEVTGTVAALTFRSGSGELRFDDVTGDLIAKTASGDVRGDDVGGNARFHGASGDLSIGTVSATSACRSASGDLSLGRVDGDAQLASASGDVEVGAVTKGKTTIRTVSGDVEVGVVEGADVYLDLSSTSGDVACDLEPSAGPGPDPDLELVVDVTSVSGDVRVRKVAQAADSSARS
jgi:DUF4097 and DUF4098 domain-containing protein YvlB